MDKQGLRIISWNVNGIRAVHRKGVFPAIIGDLEADIFCVQETKAREEQLPVALTDYPGFQAWFHHPQHRKGYSGVAVYSRLTPRTVLKGLGVNDLDDEGRTLILDYDEFILMNIYFPNGKQSPERLQYKLDFYRVFLDKVLEYVDQGRHVIICGDVNTAHKEIDLARPKENENTSGFLPEEREWLDRWVDSGLVDTFRHFNKESGHYTWWDMITRARERNVGWRIDYFFVNEAFLPKVKNAFILSDIMGSDHCPIGIDIHTSIG